MIGHGKGFNLKRSWSNVHHPMERLIPTPMFVRRPVLWGPRAMRHRIQPIPREQRRDERILGKIPRATEQTLPIAWIASRVSSDGARSQITGQSTQLIGHQHQPRCSDDAARRSGHQDGLADRRQRGW